MHKKLLGGHAALTAIYFLLFFLHLLHNMQNFLHIIVNDAKSPDPCIYRKWIVRRNLVQGAILGRSSKDNTCIKSHLHFVKKKKYLANKKIDT